MNVQNRFEGILEELQKSMDKLSGILSYNQNVSDEEKLIITSMMEVAGTSLVELGGIIELNDAKRLEEALDDLAEIQIRCSYIVERHPVIVSLTAG